MTRALLTLLAAAIPLAAQPRQIVTNHDGSKLIFTTPYMRPVAAPSDLQGFIHIIEDGRLRILRQNTQLLLDPDISRDATVFSSRTGSTYIGLSTIEGLPGGVTLQTDQNIRLSANGRFAVRFDRTNNAYRWYLDSRRITYLGKAPFPNQAQEWRGRLIADDGTAVLSVGNDVHLYPKDSTDEIHIPLIENCRWPIIDEAATIVVCQLIAGGSLLHDLASHRQTTLQGAAPVLSSNARRVLLRTDTSIPAVLFDRDRDNYQPLSSPRGYYEHTLSGDGNIAWFFSYEGIFRLHIPTDRLERVAAFPVAITPQRNPLPAVPGSLYSIYIPAIPGVSPRQASSPLPTSLDSFRVWIEGNLAPIQAVLPRESWIELRTQIPWKIAVQESLRIAVERVESFTYLDFSPNPLQVAPSTFYPLLLPTPQFTVDASHLETNAPVTLQSPARPNESVRLLMTGLGPVSPAVETGHAGTSPTVNRVQCHLWTDTDLVPLEVLSSTLAANIPGAYHVTVKLPASVPSTFETWISCDSFPLPLPFAP